MTKDEALNHVAFLLALNCYEHEKSAMDIPALAENSSMAIENNREAAKALGITAEFMKHRSRFVNKSAKV